MKTLAESLFDKDIVSSSLPYEKLLKSRMSKSDIVGLIDGINEGDYDDIKNQYLAKWADDIYNKYYKGKKEMLWIGTFGLYDPDDEFCQEAISWIKFNKIHTDICWNDRMYANTLDINFFDNNSSDEDIFEWIMFSKKDKSGFFAYLLVNRKEYDEWDQKVIHKLIEIIEHNKKGAR